MTSIRSMTMREWWVFFTSPKGRIGRFDYNVKFLLCFFILGIIAGLIDYAYLGQSITQKGARTYATWVVQILSLWPSLMMSIKRLHDLNYRGWWMIPAYILPIFIGAGLIGYFIANHNFIGAIAVMFLIAAVVLTFIIILCCAKGTVGPNRFGADPTEKDVKEEGMSS